MKYVHLAGFISNLTEKLTDNDRDLPIHEQHLAFIRQRVQPGQYTYLKLLDGTVVEYIMVSNTGGAISIDRGKELTTPATFPVGTCVKWELTPEAVRDIICQMECCP